MSSLPALSENAKIINRHHILLYLRKTTEHITASPHRGSFGVLRLDQGIKGVSTLASELLAECDLLEIHYTEHDERVLSHILELDFQPIPRWELAEQNGMLHLCCHDNAVLMERNDWNGSRKAIHGWWQNGHGFVFHSVIEENGRLICVTPVYASPGEDTSYLYFAEDPMIERVSADGTLALHIFGQDVPRRLSLDPAYDRRLAAEMRARLAAGYDPEQVATEPILINV
ncbi:hypothetical protein AB9K35_17465 [Leisingera sp. XS_AS12]|uniref:hypothetical protein n=1 Tax=Leisingera sp. XS_AS12 TaxID=3241294 RepID=UPI0035170EFB